MSYLVETTFNELALLADEMEMNEKVIFSSEDADELKRYGLTPCEYNLIYKTKILYEEDYVIVVGRIDGHCTVAKDIHILTNGDIDDEDARIDGIQEFVEEYYDKYMSKNKNNKVYLVVN